MFAFRECHPRVYTLTLHSKLSQIQFDLISITWKIEKFKPFKDFIINLRLFKASLNYSFFFQEHSSFCTNPVILVQSAIRNMLGGGAKREEALSFFCVFKPPFLEAYGMIRSTTLQCNMFPYFYSIDWPEKWRNSKASVSIGQKMQLNAHNLHNKHG